MGRMQIPLHGQMATYDFEVLEVEPSHYSHKRSPNKFKSKLAHPASFRDLINYIEIKYYENSDIISILTSNIREYCHEYKSLLGTVLKECIDDECYEDSSYEESSKDLENLIVDTIGRDTFNKIYQNLRKDKLLVLIQSLSPETNECAICSAPSFFYTFCYACHVSSQILSVIERPNNIKLEPYYKTKNEIDEICTRGIDLFEKCASNKTWILTHGGDMLFHLRINVVTLQRGKLKIKARNIFREVCGIELTSLIYIEYV